jgi:hypothetical protein
MRPYVSRSTRCGMNVEPSLTDCGARANPEGQACFEQARHRQRGRSYLKIAECAHLARDAGRIQDGQEWGVRGRGEAGSGEAK